MTREQMIEKLEMIIAATGNDGTRHYEVKESLWENYGKSRTYFKIAETRDNSKMNNTYDFGYIDNETEKYVAGKHDANKNLNLSGARF